MKLKITENYLSSQMSTISTVFKKLNGKASEAAVAAVSKNGKGEGNKKEKVVKKVVGWSPEEVRNRRIIAFVKGIKVTGAGAAVGIVNQLNEFDINLDTFDYENLSFELYESTPKGVLTSIGMNHEVADFENTVRIGYKVDKPGRYVMDIKYLGVSVPSSPFKIDVRQPSECKSSAKDVMAYGKGLKKCTMGEITTLHIETKKLQGQGQITVSVNGNNEEIPLFVEASKMGYMIQYVANEQGVFFLRIKLDGKHIHGSPFLITSQQKEEAPTKGKNLFKRGVLAGSKEKRNDLQP